VRGRPVRVCDWSGRVEIFLILQPGSEVYGSRRSRSRKVKRRPRRWLRVRRWLRRLWGNKRRLVQHWRIARGAWRRSGRDLAGGRARRRDRWNNTTSTPVFAAGKVNKLTGASVGRVEVWPRVARHARRLFEREVFKSVTTAAPIVRKGCVCVNARGQKPTKTQNRFRN
jgi:hypothetical protein